MRQKKIRLPDNDKSFSSEKLNSEKGILSDSLIVFKKVYFAANKSAKEVLSPFVTFTSL